MLSSYLVQCFDVLFFNDEYKSLCCCVMNYFSFHDLGYICVFLSVS
jgi:hypothetical protein